MPLCPLRAEPTVTNIPIPADVATFRVKTSSPENPEVPFYVKPPSSYNQAHPIPGKIYRILVICPVFNGDGRNVINKHSLIPVADKNGWFVVTPTFKQLGAETHERNKSYYYPEEFSGKALLDALDQIQKKYPVDTSHLLLMGLSGGGQFVHRFALWAPDRVSAIAVNSCSWFDDPNPKVGRIPWLITIGESDPAYEESLRFVSKLKDVGALPIYKSYLGMIHEGDKRASTFNALFLTFYDKQTAENVGKFVSLAEKNAPPMAQSANQMPFVGDSQDWKMFTNSPQMAGKIPESTRIYLPSDEIAKFWSK